MIKSSRIENIFEKSEKKVKQKPKSDKAKVKENWTNSGKIRVYGMCFLFIYTILEFQVFFLKLSHVLVLFISPRC